MTDEEIFNRETRDIGGRWAYEQLPEPIREAYVEVVKRAVNLIDSARRDLPQLPPIHFDFTHDGKVNAQAFKAEGRYYIGISTGTLYMLRMVIGRMLSDPRTFAFIGQPDSEIADLPPVSSYIPDADAMADKGTAILTPNDSVCASFAWYLQDQAIMFLLGHEIAHITRGHVDYLAKKGGVGFKAQLEWLLNNGSAATLERQCLEIDADRRSIMSRIDTLRRMHSNPARSMPPWSPDSYAVGSIIRDWSISLNLLFRLFGDVRFKPSKLSQHIYPPFPIRRALCDMWAWGITQEIWAPTLGDEVAEGLLHGRSYVEYAFADILGEQVSIDGLQTAMGEMGQDHMQKLVDHWNANVVQLVEPFSYEF